MQPNGLHALEAQVGSVVSKAALGVCSPAVLVSEHPSSTAFSGVTIGSASLRILHRTGVAAEPFYGAFKGKQSFWGFEIWAGLPGS